MRMEVEVKKRLDARRSERLEVRHVQGREHLRGNVGVVQSAVRLAEQAAKFVRAVRGSFERGEQRHASDPVHQQRRTFLGSTDRSNRRDRQTSGRSRAHHGGFPFEVRRPLQRNDSQREDRVGRCDSPQPRVLTSMDGCEVVRTNIEGVEDAPRGQAFTIGHAPV